MLHEDENISDYYSGIDDDDNDDGNYDKNIDIGESKSCPQSICESFGKLNY